MYRKLVNMDLFLKQLNKIQDLLKVANVGTPTENHEKNEKKKSLSGKCHK